MALNITTIIGARPQFIKASAVSRAFRNSDKAIKETILHTGQHFDKNMSAIFFEELGLDKPDFDLGINGGSHAEMTSQMLVKIETILNRQKPDYVLVYGDTNSTLAGALAASKLHIPIAHVEAGLRSGNMKMPEEINRILTDRVSQLLFCPTDKAMANLNQEGIENWLPRPSASNVGDVMYDNALHFGRASKKPENLDISKDFVLATIHRAENTDTPHRLLTILDSLKEISRSCDVILPLHPRTRKLAHSYDFDFGDIIIIEPLGYLHMIWLLQNCQYVITDSGGIQKEAYFFGKSCVTVRDETEWTELVDAGWNHLAPPLSQNNILTACEKALKQAPQTEMLYGNGDASKKIVEQLLSSY